MLVSKPWQKFLAKTLIALFLLTNPGVPAAVHAEAATQAEDNAAATAADKDAPQQTVTLTLDKSDKEETTTASTNSDDPDKKLTDKEEALKFSNNLWAYFLNNGKTNGPQWLKTTDFSFQLNQNNKPVYSFETVQPFSTMNKNGALWFWQGRYANSSDSSSTANFGFGWRKLSEDKKSLIGLNAFYDYGFQYNLARVGLGAEYFNRQAEYRFNWYHPVSGERLTGTSYLDSGILYSYIRAVEGCDFEVGTALPDAPWWKVYAGGYYWDNKYNPDEKGYKLRSTMQLTPRISLEVGYLKSSGASGDAYGKIMYNLADVNGSSFWSNLAGKVDGVNITGVMLQLYKDGKPVGKPIYLDADKISRYTVKATYLDKSGQPVSGNNNQNDDLTAKLLQTVERENNIKTETYSKLVPYSGSVKVTVTDGTNFISGATVSVTIGSTTYTKTTDSTTGTASFSNLPTGTYTFTASATGYAAATAAIAVTEAGGSGTIALGGTRNVTITVIDDSKNGISGATVNLALSATSTLTTTTVGNGEASFSGIPISTTPYTYTANATGYQQGTGSVTVTSTGGSDRVKLQAQTITITATVAGGTGGTITDSVDSQSITTTGDSTVSYNGSIIYTMTPSAGFILSSLIIDGISYAPVTQYTFYNVTSHHSIAGIFTLPFISILLVNQDRYNPRTISYTYNGTSKQTTISKSSSATIIVDSGTTVTVAIYGTDIGYLIIGPTDNGRTYYLN